MNDLSVFSQFLSFESIRFNCFTGSKGVERVQGVGLLLGLGRGHYSVGRGAGVTGFSVVNVVKGLRLMAV